MQKMFIYQYNLYIFLVLPLMLGYIQQCLSRFLTLHLSFYMLSEKNCIIPLVSRLIISLYNKTDTFDEKFKNVFRRNV